MGTYLLEEAEGFEPSVPVKGLRFSRPAPSTTQPRFLLIDFGYDSICTLNCKYVVLYIHK